MPRFLDLLEETLDVRATSKACNVSHQSAYRGRKRCLWFRERWDEIISTGILEPARAEIARRAIWGTPNAVMREVEIRDERGKVIGREWQQVATEIIYETALTKMFAERRLPEYKPDASAAEGVAGVLMVPVEAWRDMVARANSNAGGAK